MDHKKILNNLDNTILEDNGTIKPVVPEKKVFAKGHSFFKYFWFFMIGCVFGTYYEQILTLCKKGVWVSRAGLLYGPLNPVYGIGVVLAVLCLHKVKDWKLLWTLGGLIGGAFEWLLAWLQEIILHTVSWDYSTRFLNIDGKTTIPYMCFWGLLFMVVNKVIYPFVSKWIEKIPYTFGNIITWITIAFMVFNIAITGCALLRQLMRNNGVEPHTTFEEWLDETYTDEVIAKVFENMKPESEKNIYQKDKDKETSANTTYYLVMDDQVVSSYILDSDSLYNEKTLAVA